MRVEGLEYGDQVAQDLFPARADDSWREIVDDIYNVEDMYAKIEATFIMSLEQSDADVETIVTFFETEPGSKFIELEIAARTALLDDIVEEASKEALADAKKVKGPKYQLLTEFVSANDLIETNIVSALNANFAFYMALMDGGALDGAMSEGQILSDVWSQEPDIRQSTTEWVYAFLLMAYQPMSEDDIKAYIAFSQSEAGQDLNQAYFASFEVLFQDISRGLGSATSQYMQGEDL